MPKRIYDGPYPAVELLLPDGNYELVNKGQETCDLPEDVVANLDAQGNWRPVGHAKTKSATSGKE